MPQCPGELKIYDKYIGCGEYQRRSHCNTCSPENHPELAQYLTIQSGTTIIDQAPFEKNVCYEEQYPEATKIWHNLHLQHFIRDYQKQAAELLEKAKQLELDAALNITGGIQ